MFVIGFVVVIALFFASFYFLAHFFGEKAGYGCLLVNWFVL